MILISSRIFKAGIAVYMKLLFFVLGILSTIFVQAKTIYITPIGGLEVNKFFFDPYSDRDEVARPFCMLREALEEMGYEVKFTSHGDDIQDPTAVISINETNDRFLSNLSKIPQNKCLLFVFEPPVVMPQLYDRRLTKTFGKIFIMLDDMVDSQNYYKFYYPQPYQEILNLSSEFSEKKLSLFVAGNKRSSHPDELYSERKKMVAFFKERHPEDFDLYGTDWAEYSAPYIQNKWAVIKNYKFCFCYENMKNQYGYVTEKIFDAMVGGAVPIYLGASNIEEFVPKTCFIDRRDFSSLEELYVFLKKMDRNTHESYIQSIRDYFKTPQAQLFSINNFIQTIKNHLLEIDPPPIKE